MDISSISQMPYAGTTSRKPAPVPADTDQRALIQAVKAINATALFGQENELSFILDRSSRRVVIRIVNRDTREVVRQIPAEYVLRLAEENRER